MRPFVAERVALNPQRYFAAIPPRVNDLLPTFVVCVRVHTRKLIHAVICPTKTVSYRTQLFSLAASIYNWE